MSTATDFFSSLMNQARENDRTVPKSSAVNSQQKTVIPASVSADNFFTALKQEAASKDFLSSRAGSGFAGSGVGGGGQAGGGGGRKETPAPETLGERLSNLGTALGGAVLSGADAAATGITSTADFLLGRPLQAMGWENNPISALNEKLQTEREQNTEYFTDQLRGDKLSGGVYNLGTAVSRSAWELPLIIMTGGMSKAAQGTTKGLEAAAALETTLKGSGIGQTVANTVNTLQRKLRDPQVWQSFTSATGQDYEEQKANGASEIQAVAHAAITGLLNAAVEVGGGGLQELPDVLRQPGRLRNWINTMLDEGKEEVVQGVIDRLAENALGISDRPIFSTTDENAVFNPSTSLEEFGMGALVGGILGGGQIGVDAALNRIRGNTSQDATEAPTTGTTPQTGVDTSTGVNPVEAGIDASVRLFNEGGGMIDANDAQQDTRTVISKLRDSIPVLRDGAPVAQLTGSEFSRGSKKLSEQVSDFFRSLGNRVLRRNFGEVIIDNRSIKNDMAHGIGRAKAVTFAAVPSVIESGQQIDYQPNWKGRGYDTYVFAAPVDIGGQRSYVAAVVRSDSANRFYLHEVIDGDGNRIYIKKESAPDNIKTGVTAQDGVTGGSGTLSNNSIPDSGQNVNALADSMTDEQLALEQQRNNADIASINDVLNAAQGGQQFPQGIIDQLTGQLPGLMQEQQRLASVEQAKRVQRGEVSRSFGQPENHIDNRNPDSVKGNRVAAFSFDHPQLHGYFVQAARDLQGMADYAAEAERGRSNRGNRIDRERNRSAVEHAYSRELRNAMESGDLSKPQVLDACQRIIDNHGQENVLAAKRVELILDDMLTNGYTTADGVDVAPNMEYIAAKEQIAGARGAERAIERYDDDLAIGAFGMPYTDAELAEQEVERQRIRDQYAAMRGQGVNSTEIPNSSAVQNVNTPVTPDSSAVNPTDSLGAAPRGFSVGHAPRVVENQRHAIEGAIPPSQWTEPQRHEVVPERDSLYYAEQRANLDFEGEMSDLRNKERWDGVDTDTAFTILQRLSQRAMETNSEADNQSLAEWQRLVDDRGSAAGSELQARAKWARLAETPELLYAEAVDLLNSPNVRGLSQEQKARVRQSVADAVTRFKSIDPNDTASMIDLIRSLSQTRRTTGLLNNETSRLMNTALNNVAQQESGAEFLRNIALSQIQNIAQDYRHVSLTERMRTLRALNLLSKPATTLRNLIGNTVFDPLESISNNTGVVFDWLIGQLTGQRTMALDQSWFSEAKRRGSVDALMRSIVEIGLDADAEGVVNRYEQGGGRTFRMTGNFIERLLSTWEKINGYMLTSTDEFAKGGVRAEAQRGLEALQERNANVSDEYIASRADEIARQRTFQNDSMLANATLSLRRALNYIPPVGDIGLGDIMLPFARVPANVATQAINYSPAGIVNGIGQFARTMWNARRGTLTPEQQAQAATALGRGLTGTAGIAAFAALALKGILNVAGSDDKDEAALDTGEGMSGTQLNLSALMRLMNGESTEWRDGDQLMSIGFLEPINALMATGSMIADSYTEDGTLDKGEMLNATLGGVIQSVLDLPAVSSIQELISSWQYAPGDDYGTRIANAALSYAGSQLPGFVVPNLVAGIASGLDNTVRAPYLGETAEDDLVNQFLADIPGLRENVPARLDSWGNERTYSDSDVLNFLNSTILPGSVTQYHTNDVNQEVRRLGADAMPRSSAPSDFSIDGEKIVLTQEQKDTYQKAYGEAALSSLDGLIESETYQSLSDADKLKVVESVYDYANAIAKQSIDSRYELEGASAKAAEYDNPGEYFMFNEALKNIEDSKGADTAAFDAVMEDYANMDASEQNALMEMLGENTRFDDVVDAYEAGIDPERWYDAYDEWRAIDGGEGSATDKATQFAQWLETEGGYSENESNLLQDQLAYYSMIRGSAERYDELRGFGFSPQESYNLYEAIGEMNTFKADKDENGDSISGSKKAKVIAFIDALNLTPAEKDILFNEFTTYTGLEDTPWH